MPTCVSLRLNTLSGWREVADRHGDLVAAGLRAQLRDHVGREVDPADGHAPGRKRQRDAAGPDPELQGGALACEPGEEVDRRGDDRRLAPAAKPGVVPLR